MDNKQQIAHLDPKLKDAYERVMNNFPPTPPASSLSQASQTQSSVSSNSQQISPVTSPSEATVEEKIVTTTPHPTQSVVQASPQHTSHPAGTVHLQYQLKKPQHLVNQKQKLQLPAAVYILGGIVFFILYTLFWIRVFNINLPFLP